MDEAFAHPAGQEHHGGMGVLRTIGRPGRIALLLAIGAAAGGAAFAVASIPDDSGVIHGCVLLSDPPPGGQPNSGANLHITDSSSPSCGASALPISWNVRGPTGPAGRRGPIGLPGAAGHGLTVIVRSPAIKNSAKPVATFRLGKRGSAIETPILAYNLAKPSGKGGKTTIHDLSFTHKIDKASPVLFKACVKGKHFASGKITVRKAGKGQQVYLVIKMKDVLISSFQDAPSGGGGKQPQEHISLNFTKVAIEYAH
jgi:hypothetical protein